MKMAARLPEALADCLEDGLTSDDATLIDQDGGRHPVSKPILAVNSKFFLALFSRSPDQQNNFPITIVKRSSTTAEGLALVLSSMARGEVEVEVKEENVMEVMQTAEYLQVAELSQYCQQVRLRRENLVLILFSVAGCSAGGLQRHRLLALRPRSLPGGASQGGLELHCGEPRGGV